MDTVFKPIDQPALIALLRADRSLKVHAYAKKNGWSLVINSKKIVWALTDTDEITRVFLTLDEFERYLHSIGVPNFLTDLSGIDESENDINVQERRREAKSSLENDEWMHQQIQAALDDPRPSISNSVVKERAATRRAELLVRLEKERS